MKAMQILKEIINQNTKPACNFVHKRWKKKERKKRNEESKKVRNKGKERKKET